MVQILVSVGLHCLILVTRIQRLEFSRAKGMWPLLYCHPQPHHWQSWHLIKNPSIDLRFFPYVMNISTLKVLEWLYCLLFYIINLSSASLGLTVRAGSSNLWTDQQSFVNVSEVVIHDQFDVTRQGFDVALIRLIGHLKLGSNIKPASFLHSSTMNANAICITTRFGRRLLAGQYKIWFIFL